MHRTTSEPPRRAIEKTDPRDEEVRQAHRTGLQRSRHRPAAGEAGGHDGQCLALYPLGGTHHEQSLRPVKRCCAPLWPAERKRALRTRFGFRAEERARRESRRVTERLEPDNLAPRGALG